MKKISTLKALFILFAFISCSTEDPTDELQINETRINDDLLTVSFAMDGEISISKTQMKTMQATADLFGIQIYDSQNKPYAFVIGDDISKVLVELKKDELYRLKATYVKDGQNALHFWEQFGEWGGPFETRSRSGTVLNKVYYSSANEIFPARGQVESIKDEFWGNLSEVDRYYGSTQFIVNDENSTININLLRMVFGLKANLSLEENIKDVENIYFTINNGQFPREYFIPVSEGSGNLEIPFLTLGIPHCSGCAIALDFAMGEDYQEDISISIGTIENPIRFFSGEITIKRNKMMVINHILEEQDTNSGGFEN